MNKLLFMSVYLLALTFLISCSDHEALKKQSEEIPVTFKISTLNVDVEPMLRSTSSGAPLEDIVNTIGYYIYNVDDYYLHRSGKVAFIPGVDPVPDNFGQFSEKLMPGSYEVVFYAIGKGNGALTFNSTNRLSSGMVVEYKDKEVFYYHNTITISSNSNLIEISLPRKSAMLKIDISDEATPDIGRVKFTISDGKQWNVYYKRNDLSVDYTYDGVITNNKLEIFEYYFSFPNTQAKVLIAVYDKDGALYGKKELNVPIFENRRTVISGKLFSSLGSQDMNITIEDIWGEDVEYPLE